MLYSEENDKGIITLNKSIINQLVSEAIKPWSTKGKLKLLDKYMATSEDGLYLCVHISLALGESMSEVSEYIINFISKNITDSLEFNLDDVAVVIDNMFTKNGNLVERNIEYCYSGNCKNK